MVEVETSYNALAMMRKPDDEVKSSCYQSFVHHHL